MLTAPLDIPASHKRISATIVALIFALLVVPTLVRAAGPLEPEDHTAPLLRLNRGVDVPESKCRVTDASDHFAIIDAQDRSAVLRFQTGQLR